MTCPPCSVYPYSLSSFLMFMFPGPQCSLNLHTVTALHHWIKWTAWTSCLLWASLSTPSSATHWLPQLFLMAWDPTVSASPFNYHLRANWASVRETSWGLGMSLLWNERYHGIKYTIFEGFSSQGELSSVLKYYKTH